MNADEIIMSIVTGVISGGISSIGIWWLLTHYFCPRIDISSALCKYELKKRKCGYNFQFKFLNRRKRLVTDVMMSSYMVLPDLLRKGVNEVWPLPLYTKDIPILLSTQSEENGHVHRRITFDVENDELQRKFNRSDVFSEATVALASTGSLSLDGMLDAYPQAFIRVIVSATDSITCSKKVFVSKDLYRNDIILGRFEEGPSLKIIPKDGSSTALSMIDERKCMWFKLAYFTGVVLSPTFLVAEFRKQAADKRGGQGERAKKIILYNHFYLIFALLMVIFINMAFNQDVYVFDRYFTFGKNVYVLSKTWLISLIIFYIWAIPLSRSNEIFWAFIKDALDKVGKKPALSDLSFAKRIELSLFSYLELVVNFGTIYYLSPKTWFNKTFGSIWDSLYFSGVTITTIGYGDYYPVYWFPKLAVVYEVFCGFILLIVSFAIYAGRGLNENP